MVSTEECATISNDKDTTVEKTAKEKYFEALRSWLLKAQLFQQFNASLPFYCFARQMTYHQDGINSSLSNNYPSFMQNVGQQNDVQGRNGGEDSTQQEGYEFVIPPLWKRFLAEQVDFLILICVKLIIYYKLRQHLYFLDTTDFIDVDGLSKKLQEDHVFAVELTADIIVFELIYRVIVCFYEAFSMSVALLRGPGGATPGKVVFGLRVITATKLYPVYNRPRDTVIVTPAGNLTFATALMRAATKNALIAILFPMFTITFFTKHNRTAYDVFCNVLVVEENANPPRRRIPY